MSVPGILLWGFLATVVLTTIEIAGQSLGLTRIDMPFIAGTIFTADRDRAKVIGIGVHLVNGWLFAFFYAECFEHLHGKLWLMGLLLGILQGLAVATILLPLLPGLHPRMVSELHGPAPTRLLEPPGFLGMNYGRNTPWITLAAHAAFGLLLGALYSLH